MRTDRPDNFLPLCEKAMAAAAGSPAGLDAYQEIFDSAMFFPLQRRRELEAMVRLARTLSPQVVMEIGSDKGGGFYHLVKCFPGVRKAIAIEIDGLPYAALFEREFPEVSFRWLEASSFVEDTRNQVAQFLDTDRIDVLFIDGDKNSTEKDVNAYLPMMRGGGMIFIHDVCGESVCGAIHRLAGRFDIEVIADTSEVQEELARQRMGLPMRTAHAGWLRLWRGRSCGVGIMRVLHE